jgi:LacI family transcriptional regulator
MKGSFGAPATTIKDVARTAGVSLATVSRVLNENPRVSGETRRLVLDAAESLRYRPNSLARSLVTNRTNTVGVLLPDLYGEFFSEVIRGLDGEARAQGYHLLVSSSHASTDELIAAVRAMHGRIDGLIVMAPDVDAPQALRDTIGSFPIVLLDGGMGATEFDSISLGNAEGARLAVRHLLDLGHRRVATVAGPAGNVDARQRLFGYRTEMREGGGRWSPELELAGDFTEPSGYEAGAALLALETPATAVFCANDYMAIGILGRLSEAGLRVPEDLSVVGFDDIVMARYLSPALTTVHVDTAELGARAVRRVLEILKGDGSSSGPKRSETLRATLAVRASSGRPRREEAQHKALRRTEA